MLAPAAALLALLLTACTVNLGFASRRAVEGDLAAASMGLVAADPWLGETRATSAAPPVGADLGALVRAAVTEPAPRPGAAPLRPAPAEPGEIAIAPALALAGIGAREERGGAARAELVIMPALGPADLDPQLRAPLPLLRPSPPLALLSPPQTTFLPPPPKPERLGRGAAPPSPGVARRLRLPAPAPWQEPVLDPGLAFRDAGLG